MLLEIIIIAIIIFLPSIGIIFRYDSGKSKLMVLVLNCILFAGIVGSAFCEPSGWIKTLSLLLTGISWILLIDPESTLESKD